MPLPRATSHLKFWTHFGLGLASQKSSLRKTNERSVQCKAVENAAFCKIRKRFNPVVLNGLLRNFTQGYWRISLCLGSINKSCIYYCVLTTILSVLNKKKINHPDIHSRYLGLPFVNSWPDYCFLGYFHIGIPLWQICLSSLSSLILFSRIYKKPLFFVLW